MATEFKSLAPSVLPIETRAPLSRDALREVLGHLKLQGREIIRKKGRAHIIQVLTGVARSWCAEDFSMRRKALDLLPANTGYSREMIGRTIDLAFARMSPELLTDYCNEELDIFQKPGSGLIAHIAPGNLLAPIVQSLFHGLLVRSSNFVRTSERDLHFPVLLARSIIDSDPDLAHALAVAHWSSANATLNRELAQQADILVVYGADETLAEWEKLKRPDARFIGFGHRVSVGFISQKGLREPEEIAAAAALDTVISEQQGCLSPHCFFLEKPTLKQWIDFGARLAEEMRGLERDLPFSKPDADLEFVVGHLRQKYLFLHAQEPEKYKIWFYKASHATVYYDGASAFSPSCLGRNIWLRPAASLEDLIRILRPWAGKLQCLGTDLSNDALREHLEEMKDLGITRICTLGSMQAPPITWANGGASMLKQMSY